MSCRVLPEPAGYSVFIIIPAMSTGPPHAQRLLFIASIGNQGPYRRTRHSAGHILLEALSPLLLARFAKSAPFYKTWTSPSFMNESGPKLVKTLQKWLEGRDEAVREGSSGLVNPGEIATATTEARINTILGPRTTGNPATLVILHDELEVELGKVRVKRGGPDAASLRGHRGLISCFQSLSGKGMYPERVHTSQRSKRTALPRDFSVLRVGIGIGRPATREQNAVADYVLTEMEGRELAAVRRAAEPVVEILEEELYRRDTSRSGRRSRSGSASGNGSSTPSS